LQYPVNQSINHLFIHNAHRRWTPILGIGGIPGEFVEN
jgi:hypothetical protein